MPVPLLDVNAQNHPLHDGFTAAFERVFKTGHFIMGEEIAGFEREVQPLTGASHALSVSSGTDAILLALMALEVGPGDEVLCPAFTFFATAGCVSRVGATPIFVDVLPDTFNIDIADARAKVTSKTKAIIPVHLFGQCANMEAVMEFANEHLLHVIEDAAQAIGASRHGTLAGSIGHFGCYSFFPSKNLGGLGDGGLLVTNDGDLALRAKSLRNHGMEPKYYHSHIGGNFRMDALQAAFLRVKLPHYAGYTKQRQVNAAFYQEQLSKLPGTAFSSQPADAKLLLPYCEEGNQHIWNQFTLRVPGGRRDALKQHLLDLKIGCEIYYPVTLDQQACFAHLPESSLRGCEVSHQLAEEVLSIPIYSELTESQKTEVVAAIAAFLN
ncbi:DegT/DnrJ/EryC1/StrS family aminotransferase [Roseimicrobium sp. ORNL1]|uniref:DegT/DnrJ/EryC1/StrS family aminotransferase n=1 Tax=Roseimicrobium sp. ORNL1 TaxID=2711231 RepID=UPI0013E17069|nr:DegT/DnrJ/EryC1/StrS family aminotransferase [Roseimicrobium sp. ORNL1]QIF03679.1 DegT/DnrJ/EryC1/StrS family aminotransferase [Roseimicrobium sp. ORNL1]